MNASHFRRIAVPVGGLVLAVFLQACGARTGLETPEVLVCTPTIVVTKPDDTFDGSCTGRDCSLREAIRLANGCPGPQIIRLPADTYVLALAGAGEDATATGDLDITDDLRIESEGAVVDGDRLDRVFHVRGSTTSAEFFDLTVRNGLEPPGPGSRTFGAGIFNEGGALALEQVIVIGNDGTGVSNQDGTVTMTDSTMAENVIAGISSHGFASRAALTLVDTEVRDNGNAGILGINTELTITGGAVTGNQDNGISAADVSMTLSGVLIAENVTHPSRPDGGGIGAVGVSSAELNDVVVRDNSASGDGGGLWLQGLPDSDMTLTNVTIIRNAAAGNGGGMWMHGDVTFSGEVALNTAAGGRGGGILVDQSGDGSSLLVTDSSIHENNGGGLSNEGPSYSPGVTYSPGEVVVENSIISFNIGPGVSSFIGTGTAPLTLNETSVSGNSEGGMDLINTGLTLHGGRIDDNSDWSGIFIHGGRALLSDVTISGNHSLHQGGGIRAVGLADFRLEDATIHSNAADEDGGGIYLWMSGGAGFITLTNVTVSGNGARGRGGGIMLESAFPGDASMLNATLADNSASSGASAYVQGPSTLTLANTILASKAGDNCGPLGVISAGHNLETGNSCGFSTSGDLVNTDPRLGPLQDNGGPTFTHALLAGSPAIDAADSAACPATDQRGVARPQGPGCDIGAFELEGGGAGPAPTPPTAAPPLPPAPTPTRTPTPPPSATPVVTPPNSPGNLIVVSAVCSAKAYTITLQWTDNAKNETGYRVYRNGTLVATLPANSTGYTDTLPCCGPTTYGVEAYNSAGSSKRVEVTQGECVY